MTSQKPLAVIVASYVSREDAQSDLEAFDALYFSSAVAAFDAALVINTAWGNAQLGARTSRSAADMADGPLHDAVTSLFGGPFMTGAPAPIRALDRRLPQQAVVRLGDAFSTAGVVLVVVALMRDGSSPEGVFTRAEWVSSDNIPWTEESTARLPDTLQAVVRRGSRQEGRRPEHDTAPAN